MEATQLNTGQTLECEQQSCIYATVDSRLVSILSQPVFGVGAELRLTCGKRALDVMANEPATQVTGKHIILSFGIW